MAERAASELESDRPSVLLESTRQLRAVDQLVFKSNNRNGFSMRHGRYGVTQSLPGKLTGWDDNRVAVAGKGN